MGGVQVSKNPDSLSSDANKSNKKKPKKTNTFFPPWPFCKEKCTKHFTLSYQAATVMASAAITVAAWYDKLLISLSKLMIGQCVPGTISAAGVYTRANSCMLERERRYTIVNPEKPEPDLIQNHTDICNNAYCWKYSLYSVVDCIWFTPYI